MIDFQEQKWIDAARKGDQEAFAELVRLYEKKVFAFAGIIEDKCNHCSIKTPGRTAAPPVITQDDAGAVIDNQQLQHQRRAADDPNEGAGEVAKRPKPGHTAEGDNETQRDRRRQRDKEDQKGGLKPLQQLECDLPE